MFSILIIFTLTLCLSSTAHVGDEDLTKKPLNPDFYEIEIGDSNVAKSRWERDESTEIKKKLQSTKKPTLLEKPKQSNNNNNKLALTNTPAGNSSLSNNVTNTEYLPESILEEVDPYENVTLPPNVTRKDDHHVYYNSSIFYRAEDAMQFWVDMDNSTDHPMPNVITHTMLSNSYRRAATVNLSFEFPFYGHPMKNVTIATGGFLYLGHPVHSWLAATQYVAPLMANFDTRIDNSSTIKYADNGTAFVIQWQNVMLKDKNPPGEFSFQVILQKNGDIIFVYKEMPVLLTQIPDAAHPVKVGLSDAYVIDRTAFFIRKKTIYEYHRAELKKENLSNKTAIYFTALPTCITLRDCESCHKGLINFDCKWCESAKRCSDGLDRHRQDWIGNDCDTETKDLSCPIASATDAINSTGAIIPGTNYRQQDATHANSPPFFHQGLNGEPRSGSGKVGFVSMMIMISLVSGVVLWLLYAYKNPQSSSGQFLIKYRPAQWRFSEARYTAASIHM